MFKRYFLVQFADDVESLFLYRFAGILQLSDTEILQRDDPDRVFILQGKPNVTHTHCCCALTSRKQKLTVVYWK